MALRPITGGRDVVEDCVHMGLRRRAHPVRFLRDEFHRRKIVTCTHALPAKNGKWLERAGLVLGRQHSGSAKGLMLITIKDAAGIAHLVIWPSLYEKQRRIILFTGMTAVRGRFQREGEPDTEPKNVFLCDLISIRITLGANEMGDNL